MKISKIEVENFKSIKKYDFEILDFNIFVGQNNHGKTNLFGVMGSATVHFQSSGGAYANEAFRYKLA